MQTKAFRAVGVLLCALAMTACGGEKPAEPGATEATEPGAPEVLFNVPRRGYSVAPDGTGFYAVVDFGDSGIVKELHLVTNWFTELEALTQTSSGPLRGP